MSERPTRKVVLRSAAPLVLTCMVFAPLHAAAQTVTAIVGATVISGAAPLADAVVVIEGARVAQVGPRGSTPIPPNASVVDGRGKFVIPGLADMHNHARTGSTRPQQNLRLNMSVVLAFGVTTVFNPSIALTDAAQLRAATGRETDAYPRFLTAGPSVTLKGDPFGAIVGSPTPDSPADARRVVADLKAAGVDAIKVSREDASWLLDQRFPVMRDDVFAALVAEAHQQGLKVYVHAPMLRHAKDALRAGVDGLLHGIIDAPVDREFLDLMKQPQAVYVPTMALYECIADLAAWAKRQTAYDPRGVLAPIISPYAREELARQISARNGDAERTKARLPVQRANLKAVFDAGIPVVMGTDTGYTGIVMGVASQIELALMVEAGLSPADALRAATINAARMFGRESTHGSIEPGKAADLLLLDASPLDDIGNIRSIHRVVKGGVVHEPAKLLQAVRFTAPGPPPGK